jgi:hypothetical protein
MSRLVFDPSSPEVLPLFCVGTLPAAPQQSKVLGLPALLQPRGRTWEDLVKKGYTVTSGRTLYGLDLVVYEGDVETTHATTLVNIVTGPVSPVQMVRWQRLAQTVNKKLVLALEGEADVKYFRVDKLPEL